MTRLERPHVQPTGGGLFLSFNGQNQFSNLDESLMEAIHV